MADKQILLRSADDDCGVVVFNALSGKTPQERKDAD